MNLSETILAQQQRKVFVWVVNHVGARGRAHFRARTHAQRHTKHKGTLLDNRTPTGLGQFQTLVFMPAPFLFIVGAAGYPSEFPLGWWCSGPRTPLGACLHLRLVMLAWPPDMGMEPGNQQGNLAPFPFLCREKDCFLGPTRAALGPAPAQSAAGGS